MLHRTLRAQEAFRGHLEAKLGSEPGPIFCWNPCSLLLIYHAGVQPHPDGCAPSEVLPPRQPSTFCVSPTCPFSVSHWAPFPIRSRGLNGRQKGFCSLPISRVEFWLCPGCSFISLTLNLLNCKMETIVTTNKVRSGSAKGIASL